MKLLFVHGGEKVKEDINGDLYTGGSYNAEVWERYLSIFQNITFVARKDPKVYETKLAETQFQIFDKSKIEFIDLPNLNASLGSFLSTKKRIETNEKIKNAIREHDCLIARLPSGAGFTAIQYAIKYKKPYLIEVVGCPWDTFWNHSIKGKFIAPIKYLIMRKTIRKAPHAIYVTNEFLQKRYPCKGNVIGCSDVTISTVNNSEIENRKKRINNLTEKNHIIIGTTAPVDVLYKGQEYVIEAISKLNREGFNFIYHLIGGGDNTYLKSVAEKLGVIDKVEFLGSMSHERVFEQLENIDIYIHPSRTEGLPRALVEAMSKGCPSLGSKAGGIPELINEKFVFSIGSVDEICTLLKSMDKKTMLSEARRSFEKAKEFNKESLDYKRTIFYEMFAKGVKV